MVGHEVINLRDGAKINVFNDYIGSIIKNTKEYYEEEILLNFIDYIPHNGVIYDIGANIGNHTLFFSKYLKPNKIISFEPSKKIFDVLNENIRINKLDNVQIFNCAVGETDQKGISSFNSTNSGASKVEVNNDGDIKIISIDNLELENPDFVKMDVEGFELHALKGMENVLSKKGPTLWIEIQSENFYEVDSYLTNLGYAQIDRWLDNYIYTKPSTEVSFLQILTQIKNKPLQRFSNTITEINLKYRNVTEKNKNLQIQLKAVQAENTIEKNKNQLLQTEIEALKETIPYLKEQVEFFKLTEIAERENLNRNSVKKLSDLEVTIAELKTEKAMLQNSLEELKQKLSHSEEYLQQYNQTQANMEALKTKNDYILQENNSLKEKVISFVKLETEAKELQMQLFYDKSVIKEKEATIKLLEETITGHENSAVEKNAIILQKDKSIAELQDKLNRVVAEDSKTITRLEAKIINLEKSVVEKENIMLQKDKLFVELQDKLNRVTEEDKTTISKLEEEISGLRDLLLKKETKLGEINENKNHVIKELREKLSKKTRDAEARAITITQLEENVNELMGSIFEKESQIQDLQESLLKESSLTEEQTINITILNERISELEKLVFEKDIYIKEGIQNQDSLSSKVENLLNELKEKEGQLKKIENDLKEAGLENEQRTQKFNNLDRSYQELKQKMINTQELLNAKISENQKFLADIKQNVKTINQLKREKENFIAETVDLKSELENEIIEKIRLVNNEELFAMKIENQLVVYKQIEREKLALNNKITKLEKQLANVTKKYNALSNSKLGKLTSKYWTIRKQMSRGK